MFCVLQGVRHSASYLRDGAGAWLVTFRRESHKGVGPRRQRLSPLCGPRKLGATKFWTQIIGIIKWIYGPSQQVKINLLCSSVTVDMAEPAIGSHLVNQTVPQGDQNDPVKHECLQILKTNSQYIRSNFLAVSDIPKMPFLAVSGMPKWKTQTKLLKARVAGWSLLIWQVRN